MDTETTTPQQTHISFLAPLDLIEALEQTAEASLRDTGGIPDPLRARLTALGGSLTRPCSLPRNYGSGGCETWKE